MEKTRRSRSTMPAHHSPMVSNLQLVEQPLPWLQTRAQPRLTLTRCILEGSKTSRLPTLACVICPGGKVG